MTDKGDIHNLENRIGKLTITGIIVLCILYCITIAYVLIDRTVAPGIHQTSLFPVPLLVSCLIEGLAVMVFSGILRSWYRKGLFRGRDVLISLAGTMIVAFLLLCVFGVWDAACGSEELPSLKLDFLTFRARVYPSPEMTFSIPGAVFKNPDTFVFDYLVRYPGIIIWIGLSCFLRWRPNKKLSNNISQRK